MVKSYRKNVIFFYIVSAVALAAAAFVDLDLDIFLDNPQNPICVWFYRTGEMPARLICPLAGAVIVFTADKLWQKIAGAAVCLGGSAYFGYYVGKYFFVEENRLVYSIVWGVGFGLVLLIAGKWVNIPEKYRKALFVLAVAGIAALAAQLLCVEGLKYLWGRVRFRDLLARGSYDAFTPWYVINGITGNKSFPSGHTAGAGMSFFLMLFPFVFDGLKNKKQLCFWAPFVYTVTVAFTRLVMGAHYLSDVAVGGAIAFTSVLAAMAVIQKTQVLKTENR